MSAGTDTACLTDLLDLVLQEECQLRRLTFEIRGQFINKEIAAGIILQTGSSMDGSGLCRWFQDTEEAREVEIDLMYQVFFKKNDSLRLEPVSGKALQVKIPWSLMMENCKHEKLEERLIESHESLMKNGYPKYVSPLKTREMAQKWLQFSDKDKTGEFIIAEAFGISFSNASHGEEDGLTGASHQLTYTVKSNKGDLLRLSFDNVPAIKLHEWPECQWGSRKRKWPAPDIVSRIQTMGCHLVAKTSLGGDADTDWRYTFSNAELVLASCRSQQQKRAYFLTKAIFYRYLKPLQPKVPTTGADDEKKGLSSYLVKTTMMWLMEEYPPEHEVWQCLIGAVKFLLDKLASFLDAKPCKCLPYYFFPQVNILDDVDDEVCALAVKKIKQMLENIEAYLPGDLKGILGSIHELMEKLESMKDIAQRVMVFSDLRNNFRSRRHLLERHLQDEDLD